MTTQERYNEMQAEFAVKCDCGHAKVQHECDSDDGVHNYWAACETVGCSCAMFAEDELVPCKPGCICDECRAGDINMNDEWTPSRA